MTQETAKAAIEEHLSKYFLKPSISIDIGGFNSSVYYVIFDGGGLGEQVIRLSHTGSETVLDAIAHVGGLSQLSSTKIWIARPAPNGVGCEQILPVNWKDISQGASTATNYQIMPGDRLFILAVLPRLYKSIPYCLRSNGISFLFWKYAGPVKKRFCRNFFRPI